MKHLIMALEIKRETIDYHILDNLFRQEDSCGGILASEELCRYKFTKVQLLDMARKSDECEECVLYPSCTHLLKNCPSNMYGCDIPERNHRIQLCYEKMLDALEQWKRGDNTEVKE